MAVTTCVEHRSYWPFHGIMVDGINSSRGHTSKQTTRKRLQIRVARCVDAGAAPHLRVSAAAPSPSLASGTAADAALRSVRVAQIRVHERRTSAAADDSTRRSVSFDDTPAAHTPSGPVTAATVESDLPQVVLLSHAGDVGRLATAEDLNRRRLRVVVGGGQSSDSDDDEADSSEPDEGSECSDRDDSETDTAEFEASREPVLSGENTLRSLADFGVHEGLPILRAYTAGGSFDMSLGFPPATTGDHVAAPAPPIAPPSALAPGLPELRTEQMRTELDELRELMQSLRVRVERARDFAPQATTAPTENLPNDVAAHAPHDAAAPPPPPELPESSFSLNFSRGSEH